uniref:Uncharacterized protein n=1 Tax=Bradyrhizobium quebecense TaxID=2748629 RepID=A0ABS3MDE3_9BRAD
MIEIPFDDEAEARSIIRDRAARHPGRRSGRGRGNSDQDDKGAKWHKMRKITVAQNGENRGRNDGRPQRQANNPTDGNWNSAYHLQSTGQNARQRG